ncbi:LysR family transcriptional regulator [Luteococcus sp. H138]|uniref:LysR family transcriptional regulator n=1 Tax=unclassified Luteococcus TaxID=2639923 RepID=UPI00313EFEAA
MNADDLVVLLEVARAGTLSGAAQALGLNHTTVARRIHRLEAQIGSPVLATGAQGSYLTARGRALLPAAEQIERSVLEARSTAAGVDDLVGLVRVSGPEAFAVCFIAPAVAAVRARHPGLEVEVTTATRPLLQGSQADVEIGLARSTARRAGVLELSPYTLGLYASAEHLSRCPAPRSRSELAEHSLVYYVEGLLRVEDLTLLPRRAVAVGSTSVFFQLEATRRGAGLGLLPRFLADRHSDLVPVLADEVRPTLTFVAALAPGQLRRAGARAVLQAIRSEVRERRKELLPQ